MNHFKYWFKKWMVMGAVLSIPFIVIFYLKGFSFLFGATAALLAGVVIFLGGLIELIVSKSNSSALLGNFSLEKWAAKKRWNKVISKDQFIKRMKRVHMERAAMGLGVGFTLLIEAGLTLILEYLT